jgi:hypothetical protein
LVTGKKRPEVWLLQINQDDICLLPDLQGSDVGLKTQAASTIDRCQAQRAPTGQR